MNLGPAPICNNPLSVDWWYVPPKVSSDDVIEEGEIDYRTTGAVLQESHRKFLVRWEDRETFMREVMQGKLPHPEGFSDKISHVDYKNAPGGFAPIDPEVPAAEFRITWLCFSTIEDFVNGKEEDRPSQQD